MKVESKPIQELLDTILSLDESMMEGAMEWCTDPDTKNQMQYTCEQRRRVIEVFRLEHLTPPAEPVKRASYLDEYDRRCLDHEQGGETQAERIIIFQTMMHTHIHRGMKGKDLSDVANEKIEMWIEENIICSNNFHKTYQDMYYNIFPVAGWKVIEDIAEAIREQRRKAPQQKLFN